MKNQLQTIREALAVLEAIGENDMYAEEWQKTKQALTALAQIEAAVGEQEPVAWVAYWPNGSMRIWSQKPEGPEWNKEQFLPLYAAPVAQQPPHDHVAVTWDSDRTRILAVTLQDAEGRVLCVIDEAPAQQPQARPDFTDEWTGYLKDGETPFERFLRERKDVQSVLKLYQRALEENERLKAQQPQTVQAFRAPTKTEWGSGMVCIDIELDKDTTATVFFDRDDTTKVEQRFGVEVHRCTGAGDTALGAKADCQFCTAPQQAEAVPPDVVRDAERYRMIRKLVYIDPLRDILRIAKTYLLRKDGPTVAEQLDAAIDAAIAQQKGQP